MKTTKSNCKNTKSTQSTKKGCGKSVATDCHTTDCGDGKKNCTKSNA